MNIDFTPEPETGGPERPTITERFIGFLRVPHTVGCLIVATYLVPAYLLFLYLDTFNFQEVVSRFLADYPTSTPLWQMLANQALFFLLTFYSFYIVRYMRLKMSFMRCRIRLVMGG